MIILNSAGRSFEQIGGWWLLLVYLLGGLAHIDWSPIGIFGASASILAVFTALVFTIPEQTVGLTLLPNLKFKFVGWLVFGGGLLGFFFPFLGISFVSLFCGMTASCLLICLNVLFRGRSKVLDSKGAKQRKISKVAEAAEMEIKK